ncbi:MAG: cobalamin biosynthesis protein [Pseudomonas sp.]
MPSTPAHIAGLGCRRGCSAAELRELLHATLAAHGLDWADLVGLASIEHKREEPGLLALAHELQLPLSFFSAEQLAPWQQRLSQPSAAALRATGSAGVAEACALALAESGARRAELLATKQRSANATAALARILEEQP